MNMSPFTIDNSKYEKYSAYNRELDAFYKIMNKTLSFLADLQISNVHFNDFLNKDILENLQYINNVSDNLKNIFKVEISNSKKSKLKND